MLLISLLLLISLTKDRRLCYCFSEHVQRIDLKYEILVEGLSCFQEVVGIMYKNRMLTQKEKEQIFKFVESYELYSASEKLLDIVKSGPIDVYTCFLKALEQTRQKDVYDMLVNKNKSMVKQVILNSDVI